MLSRAPKARKKKTTIKTLMRQTRIATRDTRQVVIDVTKMTQRP